jgi:hypothetical protein
LPNKEELGILLVIEVFSSPEEVESLLSAPEILLASGAFYLNPFSWGESRHLPYLPQPPAVSMVGRLRGRFLSDNLPNSTVITKLGKFPDMVSILELGEVNSRRWGFRFI